MKKFIIIMLFCLAVCGCGCKNKNQNKENVSKNEIGSRDIEYKFVVNCGDKSKESTLFLGQDKTFSYSFYECSLNDLHLTTGFGTYDIDGTNLILTDNYEKKWNIALKGNNIEVELNGNIQTLTK